MKQEQKCENCRYFSQHYAKANTHYHAVSCGHCLNREHNIKKRVYNKVCVLWEPVEIRKTERKSEIKSVLFSMAKQIKEMYVILKEDEDVDET